tara:strand:- start:125 stop:403 length:279 start_codon:yes stop_codon:yes gene_type:complete
VAIETAEAGGRSGEQRKTRAIDLVRAMIADAGPSPGTPDAQALETFLESQAVSGMIDLVIAATRGELNVNKRKPHHGCTQALSRAARSLFKN